MLFPTNNWEEMTPDEQNYFSDMPEKDLKARWKTEQGQEIIKKIKEINLQYGSHKEYKGFIGTIKSSYSKKPAKVDLRGINFSGYSNLINDECYRFDFSNCSLKHSDFSRTNFTASTFKNSDFLYSDFNSSVLYLCDFSSTNLTFTNFDNCNLEEADFRSSWLTSISLIRTDLGFIKFDNKTDFYNIDVQNVDGASNPIFLSFIRRKQYLKHFKNTNKANKIIYYIWLAISDCGQSFFRWTFVSFCICILFGFIYSSIPEYFIITNNRIPTDFTFYYYSVVTFTTLGFGDIVPKDILSEIIVTIEVIIGYIMLGGLISIFATKFIPKS